MSTKPSDNWRGTLLFVANTDWYLFNFRLNLLRAAREAGWRVELVCPKRQYAQALEAEGFPVHHIAFDAIRANPAKEALVFLALVKAFRRIRPAVVHLFTLKCTLYGSLATPFAGRPRTIGALTGMGYLFTSRRASARLLKSFVLAGLRVGLRFSRAILVFQNGYDREEFVEAGIIPADRAHVIRGSGVDCSRFTPESRRSSPNSTPIRLLFCGRLIAEKGIRDYLAATQLLREGGYNFNSCIAGERYPGNPSSLSDTEVDALRADKKHEYLGHRADMAELLASTDAVVLPTYYREGTPKVLLEALAAGCVIVTTTIPACDEIVDDGANGYRVAPKDVTALYASLADLLESSPSELHSMSTASRKIAQSRFSDVEVNRKTISLYPKLK